MSTFQHCFQLHYILFNTNNILRQSDVACYTNIFVFNEYFPINDLFRLFDICYYTFQILLYKICNNKHINIKNHNIYITHANLTTNNNRQSSSSLPMALLFMLAFLFTFLHFEFNLVDFRSSISITIKYCIH